MPRNLPPSPDPIALRFQWSGCDLAILETPGPMDFYELPSPLQRSLRDVAAPPPSAAPRPRPQALIPLGTVAHVAVQTQWCRMDLNVEPGPDRRLRLYLSVASARPPRSAEPVEVSLFRGREFFLRGLLDARGTYRSPPLGPGEHLFRITQQDLLLTRIALGLREAAP